MNNYIKKIVSALTPLPVKRKRLTKQLKNKYNDEYLTKLDSFETPLIIDCGYEAKINSKLCFNKEYPRFTLNYDGNSFVSSPFRTFKQNIIKHKFCYTSKPFNYEDLNNDLIEKMLFHTKSTYHNSTQLNSLLNLFISSDYDNKDFSFNVIFIDYGITNYNGKKYCFITFKSNSILENIFFKPISTYLLTNQKTSPDGLKTNYFTFHSLTTALIDFDDGKLHYFYVDILPKLKTLSKLYKNKII